MKRALIDVSSVLWKALLNSKDKENGRNYPHPDDPAKQVFINSAQWGYDGAIEYLRDVMEQLEINPRQLILVIEGKNSKADRQALHPAYKAGRDKHPQQYVEFNKAKEMLVQALLDVGAQACWQDGGVEADDVLGYLAKHLRGDIYVVSNDKDLAVVTSFGQNVHHLRGFAIDENPFGDFDNRHIPVWIALVGDSNDKIPGARGFGKGAGDLLVAAYGNDGLAVIHDLIKKGELKRLEEDVAELRELQKVIDDQEGVKMSYELGRLRIEKVNTLKRPLQWRVGMVKPRDTIEEELLRKYGGVNRIVGAEQFDGAYEWAKGIIRRSPYITLDIEGSTPPESDEWLEQAGKEEKVDVFGTKLTSLQVTFGPNMQYSMFFPHDNVEEPGAINLPVDKIAQFLDLVPPEMKIYVHNAAYELPVCYMSWGHLWTNDPTWHGFLRNVRDTAIASSYADENRSRGLKSLSKDILNYEQVSYDQVTMKVWLKDEWDGSGKLVQTYSEPIIQETEEFEEVETGCVDPLTGEPVTNRVPKMAHVGDVTKVVVQYKMNQLKASEVLEYGCDDTICTAALANHFITIMEIEDTIDVYEEVETFPAYLTALAFVQGTDFSLESMRAQEKDDDEAYDKAWPVLRDYLIKIGFEGTVCPRMLTDEQIDAELGLTLSDDELPSHILKFTPKGVKVAHRIITGRELVTQVRTMSKIAKLIAQQADEVGDDEGVAQLFASAVDQGDLKVINELIATYFSGEPKLDLASPKQMKSLLYDFIKIPVRVINDVTPNEREKQPELDLAVRTFKQVRMGREGVSLTDDQKELLRQKAKTDDTAIDMAVAFDTDIVHGEAKDALKALGVMKKVMTRRSLFYKKYWRFPHWKDGKIHAYANQCAAVTRRYSMSDPNLQQLPKKGEGVRFREHFLPHCQDAVICSIDVSGQELRLAAEVSQDVNMLACYVGDKLKDIHSITASGAMKLKWGAEMVYELFDKYGADLPRDKEGVYSLFRRVHELGKFDPLGKKADDLRKDSKNVNFGAQNGAKAAKLSETLIMPFADAQLFLDARSDMFPDVDRAAEDIASEAKKVGYATTLMGARRHLAAAILSDERGAADRAARQSWNYKIQGSAGEMTKLIMARLWKSGALFKFNARFIAPIHDELVTSVHRDHALEFIKIKHACFTPKYATMSVPILGSISIGANFADQIECGDWYIPERIEKALNDIFKVKAAA